MDAMNQLRDAIQLRGYGQLNPLIEYQNEGFRMFEDMLAGIEYDATRLFMKSEIRQNLRAYMLLEGKVSCDWLSFFALESCGYRENGAIRSTSLIS